MKSEQTYTTDSRSRAARSAGDRADLPVVRAEPASAGAASARTQDRPQSLGGTPGMSARPGMQTTPSEAAKKLAATIVKRANEGVYQRLGIRVGFAPTGLETLIQLYFDSERKAARREMAKSSTTLE